MYIFFFFLKKISQKYRQSVEQFFRWMLNYVRLEFELNSMDGMWELESIIGVHLGQENPKPRLQRSSEKQGMPS